MNTKIGTWLLVAAMALTSAEVWAKRMGGGGSVGKQSNNVVQRDSTPQSPAPTSTPSSAQGAPAAAPAGAAAGAGAAAAKPQRPWGAMLGGLAAGLGLAWLASALGFGEAFAQFLLILLLVVAVMAVIALVRRSRAAAAATRSPLAFQGAGTATAPVTPRNYQPANVGNDASARPWERTQFSGDAGSGSLIGSALGGGSGASALAGSQTWGIPADFDTEGFLRASKDNFIRLQAAWDRSDIAALRALMTDDMLAQIEAQLAEREASQPGVPNVTEVVSLEAQLLGIEDLGQEYMASVEFSGLIRENPAEGPAPFREVWNITRPKAGRGGWLVAGVQALQ